MSGGGRRSRVDRKTKETQIIAELGLDGTGASTVTTPIPFFTHMLEAWSKHGLLDLSLEAHGDVEVDIHHTVEDVGIVLGQAFKQALGDKRGITRFGHAFVPMDEALLFSAVDLSGRPFSVVDLRRVRARQVGDLPVELVQDFFEGFASAARANVHVKVLYGRSSHHQVEAVFKAFARALRVACARDRRLARMLPSTKGLL